MIAERSNCTRKLQNIIHYLDNNSKDFTSDENIPNGWGGVNCKSIQKEGIKT